MKQYFMGAFLVCLNLCSCSGQKEILPEYYGVYAVSGGKLIDLGKAKTFPELQADCRFILYEKSVRNGAYSATLYHINLEPERERPQSADPWDGWLQGLQDSTNAAMNRLDGIPQGGEQVECLTKPVEQQEEMVWIIPAQKLVPGVYEMKNCGRFSVALSTLLDGYCSAATKARSVRNWAEAMFNAKAALVINPSDDEMKNILMEVPFLMATDAARAALKACNWQETREICARALELKPGDKDINSILQSLPCTILEGSKGTFTRIKFAEKRNLLYALHRGGVCCWDTISFGPNPGVGSNSTSIGGGGVFSRECTSVVFLNRFAPTVMDIEAREELALYEDGGHRGLKAYSIDDSGTFVVISGKWSDSQLKNFGLPPDTWPKNVTSGDFGNRTCFGVLTFNCREKKRQAYHFQDDYAPSVDFIKGGTKIAATGEGHIRILDAQTLETTKTFDINLDPISLIDSTYDGRFLYLVGKEKGTLNMLDLESGALKPLDVPLPGEPIRDLAVSANLNNIAILQGENTVTVMKVPDGTVEQVVPISNELELADVALSPDGNLVAVVASRDRNDMGGRWIEVWDMAKIAALDNKKQ